MAPILKPTLAVVIRVVVAEPEHAHLAVSREGRTKPPAPLPSSHIIRRVQDERAESFGGA